MTSKRIAYVVVAVVLALTSWAGAQSNDPFVGTWRLNTAKSKYSPGPAPKSAMTTIAVDGRGYKFTVHQEPAMGAAQDWSFTTNLDGKPSKIVGNNPTGDMVAYTRVNATTLDSVTTKGGKETQRQHIVVTADGKTRTVTSTGIDAAGQKISNVAVYDKR